EDLPIGRTQGTDALGLQAGTLHSYDIKAAQPSAVSHRHAEGDKVPGKARTAADKCVMPDAHELVHRRQPANIGVVTDFAMACERRLVGENDVIADQAIMCDMAVGHEEAFAADPGDATAVVGAAIHRHALTYRAF